MRPEELNHMVENKFSFFYPEAIGEIVRYGFARKRFRRSSLTCGHDHIVSFHLFSFPCLGIMDIAAADLAKGTGAFWRSSEFKSFRAGKKKFVGRVEWWLSSLGETDRVGEGRRKSSRVIKR